jgi:hypothetical protein
METLRAGNAAKSRCYPNQRRVKTRILSVAALLAVALVPAAHATARTSSQPQTTVPDVFVTVHVTITDSRIRLDRYSARRGDEVRFIVRNAGTSSHNFTLGSTSKRGAGRQTGFSRTLKPREQKFILLFLDYRGPLPYRSNMKIDLTKPGMKGTFNIR